MKFYQKQIFTILYTLVLGNELLANGIENQVSKIYKQLNTSSFDLVPPILWDSFSFDLFLESKDKVEISTADICQIFYTTIENEISPWYTPNSIKNNRFYLVGKIGISSICSGYFILNVDSNCGDTLKSVYLLTSNNIQTLSIRMVAMSYNGQSPVPYFQENKAMLYRNSQDINIYGNSMSNSDNGGVYIESISIDTASGSISTTVFFIEDSIEAANFMTSHESEIRMYSIDSSMRGRKEITKVNIDSNFYNISKIFVPIIKNPKERFSVLIGLGSEKVDSVENFLLASYNLNTDSKFNFLNIYYNRVHFKDKIFYEIVASQETVDGRSKDTYTLSNYSKWYTEECTNQYNWIDCKIIVDNKKLKIWYENDIYREYQIN